MTTPIVAAQRFLAALALGAALGLCYGVLAPLRRRHPHISDLLFLPVMGAVWLYLGFGVCKGDLRFGYWAGLCIGAILWHSTAGRLLSPLIFRLWNAFYRILTFPLVLLKKIFTKTAQFAKILFASGKKSGTIER